MDFAAELKKDLATYRTPKAFAQHLYRTLFENNNSFPNTQKYAGMMQRPMEQKQPFFDVYLHFLATGKVSRAGLEILVQNPKTLRGIKKRVREAAYVRGIEIAFNPLMVGEKDDSKDHDDEFDEEEDSES